MGFTGKTQSMITKEELQLIKEGKMTPSHYSLQDPSRLPKTKEERNKNREKVKETMRKIRENNKLTQQINTSTIMDTEEQKPQIQGKNNNISSMDKEICSIKHNTIADQTEIY